MKDDNLPADLSPTKRALLALKQLQSQLETSERAKNEPIAIIGMGCRFPGGANEPAAFWQLLHDGVDAITEVPKERWDLDAYYDSEPNTPGKISTRYGGFVPNLYEFDAKFFRIAPREAVSLDPQQRLLLEVVWETLENANLAPEKLAGSQTGVFIGICGNDYWHRLLARKLSDIDAYLTTGNTHSLASGRLSYFFGFTGPTLSVDTACSSSLVAVHLACQSLRNRECDLALAGGVNRILLPQISINFSQARMLSPDGRCHTFDAAANGFVRGEGCGAIALKRLGDAVASQDNILALICGSAINHDGRTSGLTVPHGPGQEAVIRQALNNASIQPEQVDYIETHGTGTELGDPIEVGALGAIFGGDRPRNCPLLIGSVKTNIGHLEAAAGIASLIKVVLALQQEEIPVHLHFRQPNPHINWQDLPVQVTTKPISWLRGKKQRIAGVSSFGFSGTNAHAVLAEAPIEYPKVREVVPCSPHLLALSAQTPKALKQLADRYRQWIAAYPSLTIEDICFTANTGRSHFKYRLAIVASSTSELLEKLASFTTDQKTEGVFTGQVQSPGQVAFLIGDRPFLSPGTGRQLYETQPIFQQIIDRCDELVRNDLPMSLLEVLYPQLGETSPLKDPDKQPLLFALDYALCQLWKSWGIEPSAVLGYGVGEYVAACLAGVLSLEDSLKLIVVENIEIATQQVSYSQPQIKFISPHTGENANNEITTAVYWQQRVKQASQLVELANLINREEYKHLLKIISEQSDWPQLMASLAQLYIAGLSVYWLAVNQDGCKVALPTYPFQRQRYAI